MWPSHRYSSVSTMLIPLQTGQGSTLTARLCSFVPPALIRSITPVPVLPWGARMMFALAWSLAVSLLAFGISTVVFNFLHKWSFRGSPKGNLTALKLMCFRLNAAKRGKSLTVHSLSVPFRKTPQDAAVRSIVLRAT